MNLLTRLALRRATTLNRFRPSVRPLECRVTPATFTVLNLNDSGANSFRDCISKANANSDTDTIVFQTGLAGTISVASVLTVTEDVNIVGPGALSVALSGGNAHRIMKIDPSGFGSISIEGLSFVDGFAAVGDGGAIDCADTTLTLSKCIFSGNRAKGTGRGGALSGQNIAMTITDCTLSGNSANEGGAIHFYGSAGFSSGVNLLRTTISGNTATNDGGGVLTLLQYGATFTDCTLSGNTAKRGGAGFMDLGYFHNCAITGNATTQQGGGLFIIDNTSTFVIRNTTISDNSAGPGANGVAGGGIYCSSKSFLALYNSTVTDNKLTGGTFLGAGVAFSTTYVAPTPIIDPLRLRIESSIVSANFGPAGQTNVDIYAPAALAIDLDYSAVGAPSNLNYFGSNNLPFSTDLKLGPLANNGGPTKSHLPAVDSPVRGKGSNSDSLTTDQRGPGFYRDINGATDIGAVEVASQFTVRNTSDSGPDSLRAQVIDANRTPGVQTITFDSTFSTPKTIALTSGEIAIDEPVTILGKGSLLTTIDGKNLGRIFNATNASSTSPVTIANLTLAKGQANTGGAIQIDTQHLVITYCRFSNNSATANGGAIGVTNLFGTGRIAIDNTTFTGNQAVNGGGLHVGNDAVVTVDACTFVGNFASDGGGAIFFNNLSTSSQTFVINNSTLSNNSAARNGAIFLNNSIGTAFINSSTIYQNSGFLAGSTGGIGQVGSVGGIKLFSSIVSGNVNGSAPDLFSAGPVEANYCAIGSPAGATITGADNIAYGLDLKLGPLQDNKGVTHTHLPAADSPVVMAGSNAKGLTYDQRGQYFGRDRSGTDIGAVEAKTDFVVTNNNDAGPGSLRQAAVDANAFFGADSVTFSPTFFATAKTITLTTGEIPLGESVSILGPGAKLVTVHGNNSSVIFNAGGDVGETIVISGMTITGAKGGAIVALEDKLTVADAVITGNTSTNRGGGILLTGPYQAQLNLINTTVSSNSATNMGGGLYLADLVGLSILGSTIAGNSAGSNGGGIAYAGGVGAGGWTIRNSTFSGNKSSSNGGGIAFIASYFYGGLATITNSTFTSNSATSTGGGIAELAGSVTLAIESSIVFGNTANSAANIVALNKVNSKTSALGTITGFTINDLGGNLTPGTNPLLGPLASNGGPTQTHALLTGSPAINKGSNPLLLATDQRGAGFLRNVSGGVDIGAFEVQLPPAFPEEIFINNQDQQRSRVTEIVINFNDIPLFGQDPTTAFQLRRQSDNALVTLAATQPNLYSVVLTFTGGPVEFGSLADGRYTLTILASQCPNLDGNNDGFAGDDFTLVGTPANGLFRLFGDIDGSGQVTSSDFLAFRLAFLSGDIGFDYDNSGQVNSSDFLAFRLRFLQSV